MYTRCLIRAWLLLEAAYLCSSYSISPDNNSDHYQGKYRVDRSLASDIANRRKEHDEMIIGGKEVETEHKYPWIVQVTKKGRKWGCGGSLISKNLVLTAAHCFDKMNSTEDAEVTVGQYDVDKADKGERKMGIDSWFIHPNYRKKLSVKGDIALLVLDNDIQCSKETDIIHLPLKEPVKQSGAPKALNPGDYGKQLTYAAGWGWTVKLGERKQKGARPGTHLKEITYPGFCVAPNPDMHFCTSEDLLCVSAPHSAVCSGDSGGPLFTKFKEPTGSTRWILLGTTSAGDTCTTEGSDDTFTSVAYHTDWLFGLINDHPTMKLKFWESFETCGKYSVVS